MRYIKVDIDTLLEYRRQKNLELFADAGRVVRLYVQASEGIVFESEVDMYDKKWQAVRPFVNTPIKLYDKRIVTHNFGDRNSWVNGPNDSTFLIAPSPGMKFIISYLLVRFPKNLKLTADNRLVFEVYLSVDGINPPTTPRIKLEYNSLRELVKKTNIPMEIPIDVIPDVSDDKMIEIMFKYADPDTLAGSPFILRSSLGEYIKIYLSAHIPVTDINGNPLRDECWCVANGKQVVDF